jgi:hypothetical protein
VARPRWPEDALLASAACGVVPVAASTCVRHQHAAMSPHDSDWSSAIPSLTCTPQLACPGCEPGGNRRHHSTSTCSPMQQACGGPWWHLAHITCAVCPDLQHRSGVPSDPAPASYTATNTTPLVHTTLRRCKQLYSIHNLRRQWQSSQCSWANMAATNHFNDNNTKHTHPDTHHKRSAPP